MAVTASAGYPQLSGSLITPLTARRFLERFRERNIIDMISSTDYLGEIRQKGDTVIIFREPEVMVREYVKDGQLKPSTIEADSVCMTLNHAHYFNVKIDMIDEHQMDAWDQWKTMMLQSASRNMADRIDDHVIGNIYADVHSANRGRSAGIYTQAIDLGDVGAPYHVTGESIVQFLTNISIVLDEQNVPEDQRYVLLPPIARSAINASPLANACYTGDNQSLIFKGNMMGSVFMQPLNLSVMFTNKVRPFIDPTTNYQAYNVLAGRKDATAFITQLTHQRVMEDRDSFDHFYQGLQVYGWGVVRPESLAHGYVRFQ